MTKTDIEWLEYANEFHYGNHPEINTAVKHAIEALEKQMPREFRWIDKYHYKCPTCNAIYSLGDSFLYCKNCGQAKDQ